MNQGEAETMGKGEKGLIHAFRSVQARRVLFIVALILVTFLLSLVAVTTGSAGIGIGDVAGAIASRFAPAAFESNPVVSTIVWDLRLHRVLFAIVAGFGLATAGAVMQGVLRNPLASPFTLGIASAASFGAALAIVVLPAVVYSDTLVVASAFSMSVLAAGAL
ncbi:MAG: iron chelate uptake ABC transporter family permease subunit, partial [Methanolinea sp.]